MKVRGSHTLAAPRARVWDALQDPAVLVRTIPGCREMASAGQHVYTARVDAGIASIKGTYDGRVELSDQDPPNSYTLRATGSGGPGTIDATATVSLSDVDGGTRVDYDAEAVVGGAIAGVGQRVVAGVAKRNARSFFEAVDTYLTEGAPPAAAEPEVATAPGAVEAAARPGDGVVHRRPGGPPADRRVTDLLLAAAIGAAIALAGVLVGQRRRG